MDGRKGSELPRVEAKIEPASRIPTIFGHPVDDYFSPDLDDEDIDWTPFSGILESPRDPFTVGSSAVNTAAASHAAVTRPIPNDSGINSDVYDIKTECDDDEPTVADQASDGGSISAGDIVVVKMENVEDPDTVPDQVNGGAQGIVHRAGMKHPPEHLVSEQASASPQLSPKYVRHPSIFLNGDGVGSRRSVSPDSIPGVAGNRCGHVGGNRTADTGGHVGGNCTADTGGHGGGIHAVHAGGHGGGIHAVHAGGDGGGIHAVHAGGHGGGIHAVHAGGHGDGNYATRSSWSTGGGSHAPQSGWSTGGGSHAPQSGWSTGGGSHAPQSGWSTGGGSHAPQSGWSHAAGSGWIPAAHSGGNHGPFSGMNHGAYNGSIPPAHSSGNHARHSGWSHAGPADTVRALPLLKKVEVHLTKVGATQGGAAAAPAAAATAHAHPRLTAYQIPSPRIGAIQGAAPAAPATPAAPVAAPAAPVAAPATAHAHPRLRNFEIRLTRIKIDPSIAVAAAGGASSGTRAAYCHTQVGELPITKLGGGRVRCNHCFRSFRDMAEFKVHRAALRQCRVCGLWFGTQAELSRHKTEGRQPVTRDTTGADAPHLCECRRRFRTHCRFAAHYKARHNKAVGFRELHKKCLSRCDVKST